MMNKMKSITVKDILVKALFLICWSCVQAAPSSNSYDEERKNFTCVGKVIGGYYADVNDNCQTFHVCTLGENSALNDIMIRCLEGTVFDQQTRVCERKEEVDCSLTEKFYHLNNELYGPGIIPDSALNSEQSQNVATELSLDPLEALMGISESTTSSPKTVSPPSAPILPDPVSQFTNSLSSTSQYSENLQNNTRNQNTLNSHIPPLSTPFKVSKSVSTTSVSTSSRVHIKTPLSLIKINQGIGNYNPFLLAPHLRPSLLKDAAQQSREKAKTQSPQIDSPTTRKPIENIKTTSPPVESQTPLNFVDIPRISRSSRYHVPRDWRRPRIRNKRHDRLPTNSRKTNLKDMYIKQHRLTKNSLLKTSDNVNALGNNFFINNRHRHNFFRHISRFRENSKDEPIKTGVVTRRPNNSIRLSSNQYVPDLSTNKEANRVTDDPHVHTVDEVLHTQFTCQHKQHGKVYADKEAGCLLYHLCYRNSQNRLMQASFLCDHGLLYDELSGQCKPAQQVKCAPEEDQFTDRHPCEDPGFGIGTSDPRTKCQFYTKTKYDKNYNIISHMPCVCRKEYLFSDKHQKCILSSQAICNEINTINDKPTGLKIRYKRRISYDFNDDTARVQNAVDNLAYIEQWATQNTDKSMFVDLNEYDKKQIENLKIINPPKYINDRYPAIITLLRRKRSFNGDVTAGNHSRTESEINLINITSDKVNKSVPSLINTEIEKANPINKDRNDEKNKAAIVQMHSRTGEMTETDKSRNNISKQTIIVAGGSKVQISVPTKPKINIEKQNNNQFSEPFVEKEIEAVNNKESLRSPEFSEPKTNNISNANITKTPILENSTISTNPPQKKITPLNTTNNSTATQPPPTINKSENITSTISSNTQATPSTITSTSTTVPQTPSTMSSSKAKIEDKNTSPINTNSEQPTQSTKLAGVTDKIENTTSSVTTDITSVGTTTISTTSNETTTIKPTNSSENNETTQAPFTHNTLPETNFTCKNKKLEQFYPDIEVNCQAFHYCSPGFEANQVLDLKFLCKGTTKFDLASQKCVDMNKVVCKHEETTPAPQNTSTSTSEPPSDINLSSTTTVIPNTTISTTTVTQPSTTTTSTTTTTLSTTTSTTILTTKSTPTTVQITEKANTTVQPTTTSTIKPSSVPSDTTLKTTSIKPDIAEKIILTTIKSTIVPVKTTVATVTPPSKNATTTPIPTQRNTSLSIKEQETASLLNDTETTQVTVTELETSIVPDEEDTTEQPVTETVIPSEKSDNIFTTDSTTLDLKDQGTTSSFDDITENVSIDENKKSLEQTKSLVIENQSEIENSNNKNIDISSS